MSGADRFPADGRVADDTGDDETGGAAFDAHDAETTSVADADWLGELRAAAKRSDRSMLEQLTEAADADPSHADPADADPNDEADPPERPDDLPAAPAEPLRSPMTSVPTGQRWEPPRRLASIESVGDDVSISEPGRGGSRWPLLVAGVIGAIVATIVVVALTSSATDTPDDGPDDAPAEQPAEPEDDG